MRNIIFLFCCFFGESLFSQPGFNNSYLFTPYPAGVFINGIFLDDNLYVLAGLNHDSIAGRSGIGIIIADTNGVIKQTIPYFELNNEDIGIGRNFPIFQSSDGLITIGTLYRDYESGYIGQFDPFTSEFNKPIVLDYSGYHFQSQLIELSNGWLTLGAAHHPTSGQLIIYVSKVDKQGIIEWTKYFGGDDPSLSYISVSGSFLRLSDNTFVIGAAIQRNSGPQTSWGRPWVFAIDSLGNVKWEWDSKIENKGLGGPLALRKMDNGDWMYATADNEPNGTQYPFGYTKVVRRDSAWNLVWETVISPTPYTWNQPVDMKLAPDGNFIVASEAAVWPDPELPAYTAGCLHKITPDGEELWRVCDTADVDPKPFFREIFVSGLVVLPSGSSILIGGVTRVIPDPPQSYGWMFKVDANGCMYAPCSVPVEAPEAQGIALSVYPNPASEHFTVRLPELSGSAVLETYDALGRLVVQLPVSPGQEAVSVSAVGWHAGLYAIRLVQQGRVLGAYRVVIK
jgi:hypothetical protein